MRKALGPDAEQFDIEDWFDGDGDFAGQGKQSLVDTTSEKFEDVRMLHGKTGAELAKALKAINGRKGKGKKQKKVVGEGGDQAEAEGGDASMAEAEAEAEVEAEVEEDEDGDDDDEEEDQDVLGTYRSKE